MAGLWGTNGSASDSLFEAEGFLMKALERTDTAYHVEKDVEVKARVRALRTTVEVAYDMVRCLKFEADYPGKGEQ